MSRLSLYLLGAPRIECDDEPVQVDTRKAIALLAYLAINRERHRRDALVNLLWPESDRSHGRAALRRTLSSLRGALAGECLETDRETVALNPDAEIWLDVDLFHHHLNKCRTHGHPATEVCPACLVSLEAAVSLHRGDFLTGFGLRDSLNFDDWQFFQTEALRREQVDALRRLVQGLCARGDLGPAIGYARQWLDLDRLDEDAHGQLMLLYDWSGRRAAALRQYQECARILESSLNVSPRASLTDLYQAIVEGRAPPPPARQAQATLPAVQAILDRVPRTPVGAKHVVTVLVADAGASLSRMQDLGVEGEALLVRSLVQVVEDAVASYGGRVERALGQSVLAILGVVRTHESDPELAIRASLQVRQAAREIGLDVAVGVHTGEIYAEAADVEQPSAVPVAGAVVDRAAGLASQAGAGQILVSQATYRLARHAFEYVPLSTDPGEGAPQTTSYRVERALTRPRHAHGIEGMRSSLIGRDAELARLHAAFAQALAGQGRMVSLIGEAGVGKSRLVAELRERALAPAQADLLPLWLEGRCLELGTPIGYAPVIDMLHEYLAWRPGEDDRRRRESILYALRRLVERGDLAEERVQEMGPLLGRLLSVPWEGPSDDRLDRESPDQIRHRTFLALYDLFLGLARQRPVILVFEDLHWADTLSLDLISLLMEGLPKAPLLLLCIYRPEREHRCWHLATIAAQKGRERYVEISLGDLSHRQSLQMVESLLSGESLPPAVQDRVWNQSQGNPFFIEEVIRSLIDAGLLYQEREAWRARAGDRPPTVPMGVQSVILSRVERLDERSRHILQLASVIGRVFRQRVLAQMLPDEVDLPSVLWGLEERALVYQERAIPEVEYSFKHVLTREAVYHNLPQSRRQILHRQVAETIEALYPEAPEHIESLAHHYDRGSDVERAVHYLLLAGEKAKQGYANEEAITHLVRRLELVRALPESPQRDRLELDTLIAVGVPQVLVKGHAAPAVHQTYARAEALSKRLGEDGLRFHALMGLRRSSLLREGLYAALERGEQLLALARHTGDPGQLARAHMMQAEALQIHGAFSQARYHCEQGLAHFDPQQRLAHLLLYGNDTGTGCQITHVQVLWSLGYPDQAVEEIEELLAVARELGHPFNFVFALYSTARVRQFRREAQIVQRQQETVIRISQEHGFPLYVALAKIQRGWALAAQGDVRPGIKEMETGLAARQATGTTTLLVEPLVLLAQAYGQAGQIETAFHQLDEAERLATKNGELGSQAEMLRLRGELLLAAGEAPAQAEVYFQRALDVARRQGAKSWELRAATSLARLWRRQGRTADARVLLEEIYGWFSEGYGTADLIEAKSLLEALQVPGTGEEAPLGSG